MAYLHGDWGTDWSEAVTSFDASLTGWGVTQAHFDAKLVGEFGRIAERSRFKKLPIGTSAHDHAMPGHADFVYNSGHVAFVRAEAGASGELEHLWATDLDFVEVLLDLRDQRDW